MKILLVTDYYPPSKIGGVGELVHELRKAYETLGHETVVLTTGRAEESGPPGNEGVIRSSTSLVAGITINNLEAFRLIKTGHFDLVHLHQSSSTLFLISRLFRNDFPFVLDSLQVSYISEAREIHTFEVAGRSFRPRIQEYVERFLKAPFHVIVDHLGFLLSDRVTVVSRQNREEWKHMFSRTGSRQPPPSIVPNGVPSRAKERQNCDDRGDQTLEDWASEGTVVTYVGVFRVRKRIQNLLLTLERLLPEFPDVRLLIVGGGRGYREELVKLSEELGIDDRVVFAGKVPHDQVAYYLGLTDVFCLLSSYEGMPVAMLEAMREGIPVVATDGFGMRDLLEDNECGLLVPLDDIDAAAAALGTLIRNPELRREYGLRAKKLVSDKYAWHRIAAMYIELVETR